VSTTERLLGGKVAAQVKKIEITAIEIRRADQATPFYPPQFALTSPASDGRSVGIVRSRTKATVLLLLLADVNQLHVFNSSYNLRPK
jgi:hypothetical protein